MITLKETKKYDKDKIVNIINVVLSIILSMMMTLVFGIGFFVISGLAGYSAMQCLFKTMFMIVLASTALAFQYSIYINTLKENEKLKKELNIKR